MRESRVCILMYRSPYRVAGIFSKKGSGRAGKASSRAPDRVHTPYIKMCTGPRTRRMGSPLERVSQTLVFVYSEFGRTMQLGLMIVAAIVEIGLGAETRNRGWAPVFGNA